MQARRRAATRSNISPGAEKREPEGAVALRSALTAAPSFDLLGETGLTSREIAIEELRQELRKRVAGKRLLVAIAGAPGSGKSTLAESLIESLNADSPDCAAVLPMDGFHYDDLYLTPAGLRPRKGAPDTFDVGGLRHTLLRLKSADEEHVAIAIFDRRLEIARAGARLIPQATRIIVAEGNYLLLRRKPWSDLSPLFDLTVLVETPEHVLRERLTARWRHYKLTPAQIADKLDANDLPNGRLVSSESIDPDFRIRSTAT